MYIVTVKVMSHLCTLTVCVYTILSCVDSHGVGHGTPVYTYGAHRMYVCPVYMVVLREMTPVYSRLVYIVTVTVMSHLYANLYIVISVYIVSSVLQCVAVCCSVLQCVAVCCSVLQ